MDGSADGTDACCLASTDCVDSNTCYDTAVVSHDADADGDNDYCSSGTWYDCSTNSECPTGYTCQSNDCVNVPPSDVDGLRVNFKTGTLSTETWDTTTNELRWTNPSSADFSGVLLVRSLDSGFTSPTNGTSYAAGATIGGDTVIYNGSSTSVDDTGLTSTTPYYYKAYTFDNEYVYSSGSNTNGNVGWQPRQYLVNATVTVPKSVVLTIANGVIVKYNTSGQIYVREGTLDAQGSSADSDIIFTSINDDGIGNVVTSSSGNPAVADYSYAVHIRAVKGSVSGVNMTNVTMKYFTVRYATNGIHNTAEGGYDSWATEGTISHGTLVNNTIGYRTGANNNERYISFMTLENNTDTGYYHAGDDGGGISNSTISYNGNYNVYLYGGHQYIEDNTIEYSGSHGIFIHLYSPSCIYTHSYYIRRNNIRYNGNSASDYGIYQDTYCDVHDEGYLQYNNIYANGADDVVDSNDKNLYFLSNVSMNLGNPAASNGAANYWGTNNWTIINDTIEGNGTGYWDAFLNASYPDTTTSSRPPDAPTSPGLQGGTPTSDTTPIVQWTFSDPSVHYDASSDTQGYFEVRICTNSADCAGSITTSGSGTTSSQWTISPALSDGNYYCSIRTKDQWAATDWGSWSAASGCAFQVDSSSPVVAFKDPTPANGSRQISNVVTINVSVSDSSNSIDTCLLEWNGVNESMTKQGSGTSVYCNITKTTTDGTTYDYVVFANDSLNNFGRNGTRTFRENALPPAPTHSSPSNGARVTGNSQTISWSAGGSDSDGDAITYYWRVDVDATPASPFTCSGSTTGTSSSSCSTVDGTTYYWNIIASDSYENQTVTSPWSFDENALPSISWVNVTPDSPVTTDALACMVSGWSDSNGDGAQYYYSWFKDGVLNLTVLSSGTTYNLSSGNTSSGDVWNCSVTPYDGYENGTAKSDKVTVGNTVPSLSSIADSVQVLLPGATQTITPSGQGDADQDALTLACCKDLSNSCTPITGSNICTGGNYNSQAYPYSSMSCTYPVGSTDGTEYVRCRVYDGASYSSTTASETYVIDGTPPTVTVNAPSSWVEGTIVINASVSDSGDGLGDNTCEYALYSGSPSFAAASDNFAEGASSGLCYYSWDTTGSTSGSTYYYNFTVNDTLDNRGVGTAVSTVVCNDKDPAACQTACTDSGYYWSIGGETASTSCCGDDGSENRDVSAYDSGMDGSADGSDACCLASTDCVDASTCYDTAVVSHDADADGDNDYCSSGTWYDCSTDSECGAGYYCSSNDCVASSIVVAFKSPTPSNDSRQIANSVVINVSVVSTGSNVDACVLEWNGVNESMTKQGSGTSVACNITKSTTDGTTYSYKVFANNTVASWGMNGTRTFRENAKPPAPSHSSPSNGARVTGNSQTVSWTAGGSDSDGDTIYYHWRVDTDARLLLRRLPIMEGRRVPRAPRFRRLMGPLITGILSLMIPMRTRRSPRPGALMRTPCRPSVLLLSLRAVRRPTMT